MEKPPAEGCIWLRTWGGSEGLDQVLVEVGLVELTGRSQVTGLVEAPEAKLLFTYNGEGELE